MADIILVNNQDQDQTLTGVEKLVTRGTSGDVEFFSSDSLQSKNVTITDNSIITVSPDSGVPGLSSVKITTDVKKGAAWAPNGTEWTTVSTTGMQYHKIAYNDGVWISYPSQTDGYVFYSMDGVVWKKTNFTTSRNSKVAYNAGLWVLANSTGFFYSEDAINWYSGTSSYTGSIGNLVAANGMWVCTTWSSAPYKLLYSVDGKIWTDANMDSTNPWHIYHANGIWVGVVTEPNDAGEVVYYSYDGKIWSPGNITFRSDEYGFGGVTFGNGVWVLGSYYEGWYSYNGIDWNKANRTPGTTICYGKDKFVSQSLYSMDGKTWTPHGESIPYLKYCDGLWVGASTQFKSPYSVYIYYSYDGITWVLSQTKTQSRWYNLFNIDKANGMWLIGSIDGGWYSSDGKNWTATNFSYVSGYSAEFFGGVIYANGIWVANAYDGIRYSKSWAPIE